jgi:BMFP domain-containing protein YqiC
MGRPRKGRQVMQVENRFLDDLARVANGAIGALSGIRTEIEALVKQRVERLLADMDLVTRDEFEAVKAVAAKARSEQEALEARVAALEEALAKAKPKPATRRKRAPAAKKAKTE